MTQPNDMLATMAPDERRALLAKLLREKARATTQIEPLSYGQRALWFLYQLDPTSAAYNIAFTTRVRSPIDSAVLQRVFQTLVDRHETLRTRFVTTESGVVAEIAGARDLTIELIDAPADNETALHDHVHAVYARPFDLAAGEMLRVSLFRYKPDDYVLLLAVHHIAIDGWSLGLLSGEFSALYAAERAGTPITLPPARQYREFVHWQAAFLAGAAGQKQRDYWLEQLGGELPVLALPTDHPRPQAQSLHGATHEFEIDEPLLQRLRALAKAKQTTLYVVLLTAVYALLARYSDQDDIIVGTPMAGRSQAEFEQIIGYLVSPIALRVRLGANPSFAELLDQTRQTVLQALSNQDYPFALLVEQLRPPREAGRSPIFDVMFNLQQLRRLAKTTDHTLASEPFSLRQEEGQFDLVFDSFEAETNVHIALRYRDDLFQAATIERMAGHLHTLLVAMVGQLEQPIAALPLLHAAERATLQAWNATVQAYPSNHCLHELISAQAAKTPKATAAVYGPNSMTYGELDQRSNQLGHFLRERGVGPDVLVGVLLERSLDMLVALLGVLKAGGAYLPLDPNFPRDRLGYMLADSAAALLITHDALLASAPEHAATVIRIDSDWPAIVEQPASVPESAVRPEHLAYVIYTSGSTGRPKGVQVPHGAVVNFLASMRERPGMASGDVLLAVTTLSFDIAVLELFLPLTVGARVAIASRETAADGELLRRALAESGATILQATPVTWRLLLAAEWRATTPLRALCGGEALPPDLAQALLEAGAELWNMYGPTETTVWSTVEQITKADGPISIGRPIANTQVYVLNRAQQQQPIGLVGELYLGGAGVVRGYLNRPELTAERFLADPFSDEPNARMYRTGDLARFRADGTVDVLGRTDYQVKIRGFRIELGEIESALREHAAVGEAVVVDGDGPSGGRRLLAYLTAAGERAPSSAELRRHLRGYLPDYMIPAAFVMLETIPRTPNGKVDRRALPTPERERASAEANSVPPSSETERMIALVWAEAIGVAQVGLHDNFFDLGGHSLLAVETLGKIEQQTGIKISPALMRNHTLGQLAALIDEQKSAVPVAKPNPAPESGVRGTLKRLFGRGE